MGDWIEWTGGECPVEPELQVWVRLRNETRFGFYAYGFNWDHTGDEADIIAYRIAEEADNA